MARDLGNLSDSKLEAGRGEAHPPLLLLGMGQQLAQDSGSVGRMAAGKVGIWALVAAAALIAAAHLLVCYALAWLHGGNGAEGCRAKKCEAGPARPVSYLCQPGPRSSKPGPTSDPPSDGFLSESVLCTESDGSQRQSWSAGAAARGSVPAVPALCPQMTVPDRSKLQCLLPCLVCRERQSVVVHVRSAANRGGAPLFQARVAEDAAAGSRAGIYLETLDGGDLFAFLSTEELWVRPEGREPVMQIMRAHGEKYATMAKREAGVYSIVGAAGTVAVLVGSLSGHGARACDAQGRVMAEAVPDSDEGTCEVTVYPNVDSGLIILALLAIDKMERAAPGVGALAR